MRILLLDDHRLFLDGLAHVLQQLGDDIEIQEAQSTQHALTLIDDGGGMDLILADLSLPGLDGFAFLDALRQRRVTTPVVVISGTTDITEIKRVLDMGALGFIPKSLDARSLIAALKQVMHGDIYLPPDLWQAILDAPPAAQNGHKNGDSQIGKRQREVLQLMAEGKSNKEIATILHVAETTVKSHVGTLFKALDVRNRTACVREAMRRDLVQIDN